MVKLLNYELDKNYYNMVYKNIHNNIYKLVFSITIYKLYIRLLLIQTLFL